MESNTKERLEILGVVTGFAGGTANRNVNCRLGYRNCPVVASRASGYWIWVNIEGTRKCRVIRYRGRGMTYRTVFRGRHVIRDKCFRLSGAIGEMARVTTIQHWVGVNKNRPGESCVVKGV